jgi:hypothetical protein
MIIVKNVILMIRNRRMMLLWKVMIKLNRIFITFVVDETKKGKAIPVRGRGGP